MSFLQPYRRIWKATPRRADDYSHRTTTVYGIFWRDALVYIGVAYEPHNRFAQHKVTASWYRPGMVMRELLTFEHRDDAMQSERDLINVLEPPANGGGLNPNLTEGELAEVAAVMDQIARTKTA